MTKEKIRQQDRLAWSLKPLVFFTTWITGVQLKETEGISWAHLAYGLLWFLLDCLTFFISFYSLPDPMAGRTINNFVKTYSFSFLIVNWSYAGNI